MTTPEAAGQIAKALRSLEEAKALTALSFSEAAGRAAYIAAFQAAQAFIFDRTGRVAKTHRGVRSEFARLAKDEPRVAPSFPTFLAKAYVLKEQADYGLDLALSVTAEDLVEAIREAEVLVLSIASLLDLDPP